MIFFLLWSSRHKYFVMFLLMNVVKEGNCKKLFYSATHFECLWNCNLSFFDCGLFFNKTWVFLTQVSLLDFFFFCTFN